MTDDVPRLSDVRARLGALDRVPLQEVSTMTTRVALPLLDLTARDSARVRALRTGASIWFREDVRLADGASRVVPGIFVTYRRFGACEIVRALQDDGTTRPVSVSVDDVFPRHWADEAVDNRPRMAWATVVPTPPDEQPGNLFVALVVSVAGVALVLGLYLWGFR